MAPATAQAAKGVRPLALGGIRIAGLAVAIGAVTTAIAYVGVGIILDTVWVPLAGPAGTGAFVVGYPVPLRVVLYLAFALWCLVVAGMAGVLADLANRIRRGVRFDVALTRSTWSLALVLGAGSWLAQIVSNVGRNSMPWFPDGTDPASADLSTLPIDWNTGAHNLLPDWPLLGLAIVLGVLAYVIRAGERLQRDAEGLV